MTSISRKLRDDVHLIVIFLGFWWFDEFLGAQKYVLSCKKNYMLKICLLRCICIQHIYTKINQLLQLSKKSTSLFRICICIGSIFLLSYSKSSKRQCLNCSLCSEFNYSNVNGQIVVTFPRSQSIFSGHENPFLVLKIAKSFVLKSVNFYL